MKSGLNIRVLENSEFLICKFLVRKAIGYF